MVTTSWKPSLTVPTAGWPEGTYRLLLMNGAGRKKYVPITVRSGSVAGRLVMLNAVTTYQAYNKWGGRSLYGGPRGFADRARRVSFNRPYDGDGAHTIYHFEHALISRAERLGLNLAYLTSLDIDSDRRSLDGARGVVSLGHDEYWSVGMRDTVTRARDRGTNVAFLGANGVYWRIRLEDPVGGQARVMVGYKSASEDPVKGATTTAKWRSAPRPNPENSLIGMLYECFPAVGSLVVHDPSFFLFAGTGAVKGTRYAGLVGPEIDRAYPRAGTPRNLQVVAHSPVQCSNRGRTFSDVTYYTMRSGSGVFAVGTMLWNKAVRGNHAKYGINDRTVEFARKVTDNLFRSMAAGPMGIAHPAKPNLAPLNASPSTNTGTGGTIG